VLAVNYEDLAREVLRAIRGRRSQVAFSRRLRYRSNVAYLWESGRNFPTAATTLWAASRTGVDVVAALTRFYRTPPPWLATVDAASPEGVATLLSDLRRTMPVQAVAARTGRSRYAVSRWFKGQTEPRLPDFLRLIEATSLRVLDFLAQIVDPEELPSVKEAWRQIQSARRMVSQVPWSPAVLLVLQTADYRALPAHEPGWIARRLGIPEDVEDECLDLLRTSGQIHRDGRRWRVSRVQAIDTRADPDAGRRLKRWWAQVGIDRMDSAPGLFSYNVFSVSRADLERLEEMHRSYFRALRAVVADSEPAECVAVANLQLFALDRETQPLPPIDPQKPQPR
jgi:transcriptional regulator with XRE-family HTH domain